MQFEYEIPVEEYAAAQVLFYRAWSKGQVVKRAFAYIVLGLFYVMIGVFKWALDWPPILILLTGVFFIYAGIATLFPARQYRRYYSQCDLAGKKYHAEIDESGFSVNGDGCIWRVLWREALLKGEDNRVFMFCAKGTLFIFGKKYLTDEQQQAVRQFAAAP
jgi:hypothetical protein